MPVPHSNARPWIDQAWRRQRSARWLPNSPLAGIGELYGLSRSLTLPVAAAALLIVVATGSYRRVERIEIIIGLFELTFFSVAWAAYPNLETRAKDVVDLPCTTVNS